MIVKRILKTHPQPKQANLFNQVFEYLQYLSSFRSIENNDDVYRGKDCMRKFCEFLRAHAKNANILNTNVWLAIQIVK